MATATFFSGNRAGFAEAHRHAVHAEPKPAMQSSAEHNCPYCDQPLYDEQTTIGALLEGGLRRIAIALWMIVGALLRCVRFAIAVVLCFVGLIGAACRQLGLRIVHPHDRKLLTRS